MEGGTIGAQASKYARARGRSHCKQDCLKQKRDTGARDFLWLQVSPFLLLVSRQITMSDREDDTPSFTPAQQEWIERLVATQLAAASTATVAEAATTTSGTTTTTATIAGLDGK